MQAGVKNQTEPNSITALLKTLPWLPGAVGLKSKSLTTRPADSAPLPYPPPAPTQGTHQVPPTCFSHAPSQGLCTSYSLCPSHLTPGGVPLHPSSLGWRGTSSGKVSSDSPKPTPLLQIRLSSPALLLSQGNLAFP